MEKFYSKQGLYLCRIDKITEVSYKHFSTGEYKTKYLGYTVCRYSTDEKLFIDVFTGTKLHSHHDQGQQVGEYCVRSHKGLPETVSHYRTESELQTAIKLQEEMHNKISAQQEERDVNM